jgi:hypothetical protein
VIGGLQPHFIQLRLPVLCGSFTVSILNDVPKAISGAAMSERLGATHFGLFCGPTVGTFSFSFRSGDTHLGIIKFGLWYRLKIGITWVFALCDQWLLVL